MTTYSNNHSLIVNYLLGRLPDAELENFEARYLADENLFEELQEVEDELIDDYASGVLSAEQRKWFEQYFLTSAERWEKLKFARAISERAVAWQRKTVLTSGASEDRNEPNELSENGRNPVRYWNKPVPAWRQWAAIAAVLLCAVALGILLKYNRDLRRELAAAKTISAKLRDEAQSQSTLAAETKAELAAEQRQTQMLEEQLEQLQTSPPGETPNVVISAVLSVDYLVQLTRGEGEKKIKTLEVPVNALMVRLSLELGKVRFGAFNIVVRRADESIVWRRSGISAKSVGAGQRLALSIPAEKLPAGDYDLVISGVPPQGDAELVGHYYLKVRRTQGAH
jgi:hypothetical protein